MMTNALWRRLKLGSGGLLLSLTGCLAGWEAGIDALAAPDALANARSLPYSGLATLADAFIQLF